MEIIKAGTKIVFKAHASIVGTDACEFFILDSEYTDEELSREAWDFGINHAECYGIYNREDYSDESDEDSYSDNIEGWYEIYDPKEHDGLRCGGDTSWGKI